MKRGILAPVLGFGFALATSAACADPLADHPQIIVTVVEGKVQLSEDPVQSLPTEGAFVWRLPAGTGYAFPKMGIVVVSQGRHDCFVTDNGQGFRCEKKKHESGATYKYTVTLVASGSGQAPPALDPTIFDH